MSNLILIQRKRLDLNSLNSDNSVFSFIDNALEEFNSYRVSLKDYCFKAKLNQKTFDKLNKRVKKEINKLSFIFKKYCSSVATVDFEIENSIEDEIINLELYSNIDYNFKSYELLSLEDLIKKLPDSIYIDGEEFDVLIWAKGVKIVRSGKDIYTVKNEYKSFYIHDEDIKKNIIDAIVFLEINKLIKL